MLKFDSILTSNKIIDVKIVLILLVILHLYSMSMKNFLHFVADFVKEIKIYLVIS